MKNNIYEIINDAEFNDKDYDFEFLNDIDKKKYKKNIRKSILVNRHKYKKVVPAVMTLFIGIGIWGTGTQAGAEVIMKVKEDIALVLGIEKNIDDYKTVINKSVTDKNITIQLNEVILDERQLIISSSISSNKVLNDYEDYDAEKTIYINNKKVKFTGESGCSSKIDDHTSQSVLFYDLDGFDEQDLQGELDIKIVYHTVMINYENPVRGKWVFEFKASRDALMTDTDEIKLDYDFILNNGEKITLEKYKSNNIGENIYAKRENINKHESYDVVLKGNDDLGNRVMFYTSRSKKDFIDFKYDNYKNNINSSAKQLTLAPYVVKMPEESGKMPDVDEYVKIGEEFTIDLSE